MHKMNVGNHYFPWALSQTSIAIMTKSISQFGYRKKTFVTQVYVGCIWICFSTIRTQTLHLKGNTSIGMFLMMVLLRQVFGRWTWTRWCISVRDRHVQELGSCTLWWIVRFPVSRLQLRNPSPPHAFVDYWNSLIDVQYFFIKRIC